MPLSGSAIRFDRGQTVCIQRNSVSLAVLVCYFFAKDKRQRVNLNFNIAVFAFINAQPEHNNRFSARANLGFTHPKHCTFIFSLKEGAQHFRHSLLQYYLHVVLRMARARTSPRHRLNEYQALLYCVRLMISFCTPWSRRVK